MTEAFTHKHMTLMHMESTLPVTLYVTLRCPETPQWTGKNGTKWAHPSQQLRDG